MAMGEPEGRIRPTRHEGRGCCTTEVKLGGIGEAGEPCLEIRHVQTWTRRRSVTGGGETARNTQGAGRNVGALHVVRSGLHVGLCCATVDEDCALFSHG
jgi:hypothetical protein